jgi:hypothetical protein
VKHASETRISVCDQRADGVISDALGNLSGQSTEVRGLAQYPAHIQVNQSYLSALERGEKEPGAGVISDQPRVRKIGRLATHRADTQEISRTNHHIP